jgi:hypothetical protein
MGITNNEDAIPNAPQSFSADPGSRRGYLLGAFVFFAIDAFLLAILLFNFTYDTLLNAAFLSILGCMLGKQAIDRLGRIEIFDDRIEWRGPMFRKTVVFDGTEEVVAMPGGVALRQGAARIPLYRRHPRIARIEALLADRSRVFNSLQNPALPFNLTFNLSYGPFGALSTYFWLCFLFVNLSDAVRRPLPTSSIVMVAAILLMLIAQVATRKSFTIELTLEPDRIVLKRQKETQYIPAGAVRCNATLRGILTLASSSGRPVLTVPQDNVPIPLHRLKSLIDRNYPNPKATAEA